MPDRRDRFHQVSPIPADDEYLHKILTHQEIMGGNPLVALAVGRTPSGTGFAILRQTLTVGAEVKQVVAFQRRWQDAPTTVEEALQTAHDALGWYIAKLPPLFP